MANPPDPSQPDPAGDSLIGKVRKLLAMAEGSANSNEADAFSRKAAELIAQHRICLLYTSDAADDLLQV